MQQRFFQNLPKYLITFSRAKVARDAKNLLACYIFHVSRSFSKNHVHPCMTKAPCLLRNRAHKGLMYCNIRTVVERILSLIAALLWMVFCCKVRSASSTWRQRHRFMELHQMFVIGPNSYFFYGWDFILVSFIRTDY